MQSWQELHFLLSSYILQFYAMHYNFMAPFQLVLGYAYAYIVESLGTLDLKTTSYLFDTLF